jgi:hypothetical protein
MTDIVDNFRNLPMRDLIANPLIAAAEGQQALVGTFLQFLNSMFDKDKEGMSVPKTMEMQVDRPVFDPKSNQTSMITSKIKAPLLGLVPIPALLVKTVDLEFNMEVKSTLTETEGSEQKGSLEGEASFGFGLFKISAHFSGSVSSHRETTRSSDTSAKYNVKVHAAQMDAPETLSRLLDLLNQSVEPITLGDEGSSNKKK